MIHAVAYVIPAFFITAVRVRAEQHTTRFQSGVQIQQLLARDMKQCGVGEHPVKIFIWQFELEEILLPYFTSEARAIAAKCAAPSKPTAL